MLCVTKAKTFDILHGRVFKLSFKNMRQMVWADVKGIRNVIQIQILSEIFIQVVFDLMDQFF